MAIRRTSDSKRTPRSAAPPPPAGKPIRPTVVHGAPLSNTRARKKTSSKPAVAASPAVEESHAVAASSHAAPSEAAAAKVTATRRRAAPRKKGPVLSAAPASPVSEDERRGMIAVAAYLRGERRAFALGGEVEDWLVAEKEVDALLLASQGAPPFGKTS